MKKSKLIEGLKSLSNEELKDFGKSLERSGLRSTSGIMILFKYLKKFHPAYPAEKIDKSLVGQKLFGKEKNVDKKLRGLMSNLNKSLEDYLINLELNENETSRNFLLLDVMRKRKMDKLFFQKINHIQKDWEKNPPSGLQHLHNEYKLARLSYTHPNYSLFPDAEIGMAELTKKIDSYYFAIKLYYTLVLQNNQQYLKFSKFPILDISSEISTFIQSNESYQIPSLSFLSHFLSDYKAGNFEDFHLHKEAFVDHFNSYDIYEQSTLLMFLQHACYANYQNGDAEYLKEIHFLNVFGIDNNLFVQNGYIPNFVFRNIVLIACSVKEFDWIDEFIESNKDLVEEDKKYDTINLSEAVVAFNKKDYDLVLEKLATIKFQEDTFAVQAKSLQLMSYYDLGDDYIELFLNAIKSYSMFLSRSKNLADSFKQPYKEFIHLSKKLFSVEKKSIQAQLLYEEIQNQKQVSSKLWLLEKAKALL